MGIREEYDQAVAFYVQVVSEVKPDQWELPAGGRGETVRQVAATGSRPLTTTRDFITAGGEKEELHGPLGYFIHPPSTDPATREGSERRGREALERFQVDDPASVAKSLAEQSLEVVHAAADDRIAGTQAGGMRVIDYLPSRTMETSICAIEVAEAIGSATLPPVEVQEAVARLLCDIAIARGKGSLLLTTLWGQMLRG